MLKDDGKHLHGEWFLVHPWEVDDILEAVGFRMKQKGML